MAGSPKWAPLLSQLQIENVKIMPKPVCVGCERFYRPKVNGYTWIEGMPESADTPPGLAQPAGWRPYKLWSSDLWECPDCKHQIIVGHCQQPIEKHDDRFVGLTKNIELMIKDC